MTQPAVRLLLAAMALGAALIFAPTWAQAIDLPIRGGPGGAPFRIRCDPGSFVTGFEGRTGAYIDHFRIQCGSFDPVARRITPHGAVPITIGFSSGGGPSTVSCPTGWALFVIKFEGTNDNFVHHIDFECAPPVGPEILWQTYGPTTPKAYVVQPFKMGYFGFGVQTEACPPGEFAVGMQGRAGLYVDALGLICEPLPAAPPAPPPQAISPNSQPNTTLNKPLGKQAIVNTLPPGPAPAPVPAPQVATAPTPAPAKHTSFTGTWDTRTDKNWTYVITFDQDGRNVSGRYVAQNGDKGKISGRVKDNVLEFKWEQDGGFKGSGQFALAADGNSFSGVYTTEPNKKITDPRYLQGSWTGTRR